MIIVCTHCLARNRVPDEKLYAEPTCGRCHQAMIEAKPIDLTDESAPTFLQYTEMPILVDFWASWCGPCQSMAPHFNEASKQAVAQKLGVQFAKINTEQAQTISSQMGIRSIPTLMLFKNGQVVAQQAGAMSAPQLLQWLKQAL